MYHKVDASSLPGTRGAASPRAHLPHGADGAPHLVQRGGFLEVVAGDDQPGGAPDGDLCSSRGQRPLADGGVPIPPCHFTGPIEVGQAFAWQYA